MLERISHRRKMPAEWPELLDAASRIIPSDLRPDDRMKVGHMYRLMRRADKLPITELQKNAYYSQGELIFRFAHFIKSERIRSRVVHEAAVSMVGHALRTRLPTVPLDKPFEPRIHDLLDPRYFAKAIEPVAKVCWGALPAPQRALSDALALTTTYHRACLGRQPRYIPRVLWKPVIAMIQTNTDPAAKFMAMNTLTGASGVMTVLLTGRVPGSDMSDGAADRVIDLGVVQKVCRSRAFLQTSLLRFDEFEDGVGWHSLNGEAWFDAGILAQPPLPLDRHTARHQHEERLTCPATQVANLPAFIGATLLPEVIARAQQLTPADYYNVLDPM